MQMPELAAAYAVGFLACLSLTGLFALLWRRRRESGEMKTLNENLHKAGFYFAESTDRLVRWSAEDAERERSSGLRTILITGGLLTFLSWAGVFFLLVIMISYRFLARSRLEKLLSASPLAAKSLERAEIEAWLDTNVSFRDQQS